MKANQSDYSKMKRKVFMQMLVMIATAFSFVLILYSFLQGKIGEWVIRFITTVSGSTCKNAIIIYTSVFRDHWYEFMFAAVLIVFLCLFRFSLNWFGKYFDRINRGVDALVCVNGQDIIMPPEMKFMEEKLNSVRHTLAKQRTEMELAEQKRNDLIMYLAHDIRTPLTSVVGYLSLLDEYPDMPTEEKDKYIRITFEKSNRLEKLVDEFFEITRLNQNNTVLNKISLDLSCMLMQLADVFYPQLQDHKQDIKLAVEGKIFVLGDSTYLIRAFQNILKNAVAYGDNDTDIRVGASCEGETVTVIFTNTGAPISPEEQKHIFDKFYRADVARQAGTGGAGLGLAIAKNIITQNGGTISVNSNNRTTTFTVVLPGGISK